MTLTTVLTYLKGLISTVMALLMMISPAFGYFQGRDILEISHRRAMGENTEVFS